MRKRLTYTFSFVILTCLLVFFACKKVDFHKPVDLTDPNKALDVATAKKYYKILKKEQGNLVSSLPGDKAKTQLSNELNHKMIYWQKAYVSQNSKTTFVEVPLYFNRRPTYVLRKTDQTMDRATANELLNGSFDRVIFYKNKKTGKIDQCIVTYSPTLDYLRKHKDISHNQIDKLDKDFCGYLEYKNWDLTELAVYKIQNGKIVKVHKPGRGNLKQKSNGRVNINTGALEEYCESYCYDYYSYSYVVDAEGNISDMTYDYLGSDCIDYCYWIDDVSDGGDPTDGLTGDPCIDYGVCDEYPTPSYDAYGDPCDEKAGIVSRESNSVINSANLDILTNTVSSNAEWGAEQNLKSLSDPNDFMNVPPRTDNVTDKFEGNFTWNSTDGYTIGTAHGHNPPSAPSPADVILMMTDYNLVPGSDQQFYKDNVSETIISNSNTYVVNPGSWTSFETVYEKYLANAYYDSNGQLQNHLNDQYVIDAAQYMHDHPGSTLEDATIYALLKLFGDAIDLFKAPFGSTNFQVLRFDANGNVTITSCN